MDHHLLVLAGFALAAAALVAGCQSHDPFGDAPLPPAYDNHEVVELEDGTIGMVFPHDRPETGGGDAR